MIFYLSYLSSTTKSFTEAGLSDILLKSRVNNQSLNITGMLLYRDGNILQVLEGQEETVMGLYHTIAQDNRHSNIIKMISGYSEKRNFPEWTMGFKQATAEEWIEYASYFRLTTSIIDARLNTPEIKIDTLVKSFLSNSLSEYAATS